MILIYVILLRVNVITLNKKKNPNLKKKIKKILMIHINAIIKIVSNR